MFINQRKKKGDGGTREKKKNSEYGKNGVLVMFE